MKFYTGGKTIFHDGKPYGPHGEIDLDEKQGNRMGLALVKEEEVLTLTDYQPGGTITLTEEQADVLNQAIESGDLVSIEGVDEAYFSEGDEFELTAEHVKVLAEATKGKGGKGGNGGDGPTYIQDMTIILMPSEAKILAKGLGPGVEGRMFQKDAVIALKGAEAELLEAKANSGTKNARRNRTQGE